MLKKPTQVMIAAALHVSPGRVSQLVKAGMPTWSLDAATAWKAQRVAPPRGARRGSAKPASSGRVADLAALGHQLDEALLAGKSSIALVHVAALRKLLREQVRQSPGELSLQLSARVWVALLDYLIADDVRLRRLDNQAVMLTPSEVAANICTLVGVWPPDLVIEEACDWRDWSLDTASETAVDE